MTGSVFRLIIALFVVIWEITTVASYQLELVDFPADLENVQVFTDSSIKEFDGSDSSKPIYMALKGVVFDLSSGKSFYGHGSTYNILAGKDCTRAVAKMSLNPEDLNRDLSDLSDALLESLDKIFAGTYMSKYPVVGYMD